MCHRVAEHSETNRRRNIARDLCPILKISECVAVGSLHVLRWAKLRILRSRPSANALFRGARASRGWRSRPGFADSLWGSAIELLQDPKQVRFGETPKPGCRGDRSPVYRSCESCGVMPCFVVSRIQV